MNRHQNRTKMSQDELIVKRSLGSNKMKINCDILVNIG